MPCVVYILRSVSGLLYIGHTKDINKRLRGHRTRKGAKFVRDYGDFALVYSEQHDTRVGAMRREDQIKRWSRAKKDALIANDLVTLKRV